MPCGLAADGLSARLSPDRTEKLAFAEGEHQFESYRRVVFRRVVFGHSVGAMTDTHLQRVTVYVSGWLEYQIDNPNAFQAAEEQGLIENRTTIINTLLQSFVDRVQRTRKKAS